MKSLAHAAWRLLPKNFRRAAMTGVAARLAARPDTVPPPRSNGVVVAGDIAGANGLAESTRLLHDVIAAQGLARGLVPLGLPSVVPVNRTPLPPGAAVLAVVNGNILPVGLLRLPRNVLAGRRVIAHWAWELPSLPKSWTKGAAFAHEIWAPSQFCADAFEAAAPGRVRVVPHPLAAVEMPVAGSRAAFGLPADVFIVLTIFNLASSAVRKNPLGAIAAFRAAFGDSPDHLFVLKISGTAAYQQDLAEIRAAIGDTRNITLRLDDCAEPELRGLIRAADLVLSLHRAEGFGLIPATAMLLGVPVVATGWSGNLDFMTPETASLVAYRLVPVNDPRGVYDLPKALWAEPKVEDAADRMRVLAADTAGRRALGLAGQGHARRVLGAEPLYAALAANGIA